jgi:DNA-binding transcriptional ArsR family regulator
MLWRWGMRKVGRILCPNRRLEHPPLAERVTTWLHEFVDDAARAIADPVRRSILQALAEQPLSAGDIAANFTVSRPAVSRHLRVLRECGLVIDQVDGRRRVYTVDTRSLEPLLSWITDLNQSIAENQSITESVSTGRNNTDWERRLDALETEVHRTKRSARRAITNQEETA